MNIHGDFIFSYVHSLYILQVSYTRRMAYPTSTYHSSSNIHSFPLLWTCSFSYSTEATQFYCNCIIRKSPGSMSHLHDKQRSRALTVACPLALWQGAAHSLLLFFRTLLNNRLPIDQLLPFFLPCLTLWASWNASWNPPLTTKISKARLLGPH